MAETKIYIPDSLDAQLREVAMKRFGYGRGSISKAVETAVAQWLAREDAIAGVISAVVEKAKKDKNVIAVLLFGSYAKMEPSFEDVDIALLLKDPEKTDMLAYDRAVDEEGAFHKLKVDIVALNKMPVTIQGDVLEDAVKLYVRDRDALYDYCIEIMKSYNDAQHIRRILAS